MSDRPDWKLQKRSVSLGGHRTSVALEAAFWAVLDSEAKRRELSLAGVVAAVDEARAPGQPLASALRLFALNMAARGEADA